MECSFDDDDDDADGIRLSRYDNRFSGTLEPTYKFYNIIVLDIKCIRRYIYSVALYTYN